MTAVPEQAPETFVRPNGKSYRPRRSTLRAESWENPDDVADMAGCVILGTLSPDRARTLAEESCAYWHCADGVKDPVPDWWRLAPRDGGRRWITDPARGVPGVMWTAAYR